MSQNPAGDNFGGEVLEDISF